MKRRKDVHDLRVWGDIMIRHKDHADEWGENILYGAGLLQGRVQDASNDGHKILCADMKSDIQRTGIAVNSLPPGEQRAVRAWYTAELDEDGRVPTLPQVATRWRTSLAAFESALKRGERKVLVLLSGC